MVWVVGGSHRERHGVVCGRPDRCALTHSHSHSLVRCGSAASDNHERILKAIGGKGESVGERSSSVHCPNNDKIMLFHVFFLPLQRRNDDDVPHITW